MDGMNWFRRDQVDAQAQKRAERKALRDALLMTAASVVVALSVVLAMSASNVRLPVAEEFVSAPIGE